MMLKKHREMQGFTTDELAEEQNIRHYQIPILERGLDFTDANHKVG